MSKEKVSIVFDDVFFGYANTGIARYWKSIFAEWSIWLKDEFPEVTLFILNRTNTLVHSGFELVPFPGKEWGSVNPAADRDLVSKVCQTLNASVFISSYYGFALQTPTVLVVHDLIPEKFGFDERDREWIERKLSIIASDMYVAVSQSTRNDLLQEYLHISPEKVRVGLNGVETSTFTSADSESVNEFKKRFNIQGEYAVLPGSRYSAENYKNASVVFKTISSGNFPLKTLVLTGGEPLLDEEIQVCKKAGVNLIRVLLSDKELSICYSGAQVVIYPSLYEGFGLPPLEALAVGAPVITTNASAIPESVGNLSMYFDGITPESLLGALANVDSASWRAYIQSEGPKWAATFNWKSTAKTLIQSIIECSKVGCWHTEQQRSDLLRYNNLSIAQQR